MGLMFWLPADDVEESRPSRLFIFLQSLLGASRMHKPVSLSPRAFLRWYQQFAGDAQVMQLGLPPVFRLVGEWHRNPCL